MAKFARSEIRKIIGEACTEEMESSLVALHLGVVDPLKDDLAKYKALADQLPGGSAGTERHAGQGRDRLAGQVRAGA